MNLPNVVFQLDRSIRSLIDKTKDGFDQNPQENGVAARE